MTEGISKDIAISNNNITSIKGKYISNFFDILEDVRKCKDMGLENADIKDDIDTMLEDISRKIVELQEEDNRL